MAIRKKRIKMNVRIKSDPSRLYDALTNPIKLSIWFCNKAEINPKLRGAFNLSGENCAATSFPEKEIKGSIIELEPNYSIGYSWKISNVESEVKFNIEERNNVCNLSLIHSKIPEGSHMTDAWIIYLLNLKSFLEEKRPAYRFDYSHIRSKYVKCELFIETLPKVVYKALTNQRDLRVWFAKESEIDLEVGGKYLSGWKSNNGKPEGPLEIKELIENKKLVYSWENLSDKGSGDLVTWELVRIGEKTRVSLKHTGFAPERKNKDYAQGWHAYILQLKDFCENNRRLSCYIKDSDY